MKVPAKRSTLLPDRELTSQVLFSFELNLTVVSKETRISATIENNNVEIVNNNNNN